jgi:hypothetical protein
VIAIIVFAVIFIALEFVPPRFTGAAFMSYSSALTVAAALVATIALFPYVRYIYPAPRGHSYYAEATHAMWLPAERIELSTGRVYYGYVLASGGSWFTLLLDKSRTIAYVPAAEIVNRSVCQPRMPAEPAQHPPLIPWLYHPPALLRVCPASDGGVAKVIRSVPADHVTRQQPESPASRPVAGQTRILEERGEPAGTLSYGEPFGRAAG